MRRLTLIATLSLLLLASCVRNKTEEEHPLLGRERVAFPVLETPSVFTGSIGFDDYLVFVEHSDSLSIQGHYLSFSKEISDTIAFHIEAKGSKAVLYRLGEEQTLRPRNVVVDEESVEGMAKLGWFKATYFKFKKLEIPAFQFFEDGRYQKPLFSVEKERDVTFAHVEGYWTELADETAASTKLFNIGKTLNERELDLNLDLYFPKGDTLTRRPLVVLAHGGAFYYGSKDDKAITRWCRHLASMGYVAASIDYRLGFLPSRVSIGRAGYRAVQDAHAAMRFLVAHQEDYGIDTSMMFVGGTSAGAITMLNLVFMNNDNRPVYTHEGRHRDLGTIETGGNDAEASFRVRGIVDMWGAIPDTVMMRGHSEPIMAFHGDADNIVPYGNDYPFQVAGVVKSLLTDKMYGSSCIVDRAIKSGHQAHIVTFPGYRHSPHINPLTNELNENFYTIQEMMTDFFHDIVEPVEPQMVRDGRHFSVEPKPIEAYWKVEGGVIVSSDDDGVEVVWIGNVPHHSITVSAAMPYGIGFTETMDSPL